MLFLVLCPGTPGGSTGNDSSFKVSEDGANGLESHGLESHPTDWEN